MQRRLIYGSRYKKSLYMPEQDIIKNYIVSIAGPCSKLVRTNIIRDNNLYFPENIIYEDLAVVPTWAIFAGKIAYIEKAYYYYYVGNSSTMRQQTYSPKLKTIFKAMEHLENLFKQKGVYEDYFQELEYLYIEHLLYAGTGRFINYEEAADDIEKVHEVMEKKFPNWKKNRYYLTKSYLYKFRCRMFFKNNKFMIELYKKIRSFRKNG